MQIPSNLHELPGHWVLVGEMTGYKKPERAFAAAEWLDIATRDLFPRYRVDSVGAYYNVALDFGSVLKCDRGRRWVHGSYLARRF